MLLVLVILTGEDVVVEVLVIFIMLEVFVVSAGLEDEDVLLKESAPLDQSFHSERA